MQNMKFTLSIILFLMLLLTSEMVFAAPPSNPQPAALEKVSLQLKWTHQFQFAGYYAAKEQGYYAQEGLDVDILEATPENRLVKQVTGGEVDFAIGDSGILVRASAYKLI